MTSKNVKTHFLSKRQKKQSKKSPSKNHIRENGKKSNRKTNFENLRERFGKNLKKQ
jgi:hypothetical protein